jgi:signal transduction histidine kinase
MLLAPPLPSRLATFASRPHLPRRTVRLRLTLLYGALFLASGAALLTITYLLVRHSTGPVLVRATTLDSRPPAVERVRPEDLPRTPRLPPELQAQAQQAQAQARRQRAEDLRQLLVQSGIALGLMTVISIGLGWLMAGRVLRPLRTMTATTRRISEHNLHERLALQGPSDDLKDLGDTIDGLLARLEAAFDAQRRFVANASHELRTPLAMMRTSLDVATGKPGPVPPQVNALEGKLREGLDRADRLLESFLTLARAQHAALPEGTAVSLTELVSAAIEGRSEAIAERGLELQHELRDARVTGSETLLSHMVENVVDNAIRHNQPAGWVRVETEIEAGVARLVVESGGPRLTEREVQELAQPFRRLGAERTGSENGVGLGLSIVAAIAAAHGGELQLHARPQGGVRAAIELPSAGQRLPAAEPA